MTLYLAYKLRFCALIYMLMNAMKLLYEVHIGLSRLVSNSI